MKNSNTTGRTTRERRIRLILIAGRRSYIRSPSTARWGRGGRWGSGGGPLGRLDGFDDHRQFSASSPEYDNNRKQRAVWLRATTRTRHDGVFTTTWRILRAGQWKYLIHI